TDCAAKASKCCGGICAYEENDIDNCGVCGKKCTGQNPFCHFGTCGTPPCTAPELCAPDSVCCGGTCCATGMLCCQVPGPGPSLGPTCVAPQNGTCPVGCPLCG